MLWLLSPAWSGGFASSGRDAWCRWRFVQVGNECINELIGEVVEDILDLLLKVLNVDVGVVECVYVVHPLCE